MWGDRWLKEWRNTMWRREREREKGRRKGWVKRMWKCGEAEDNREAAVVIVTATTFQVTERSFPLSRLCARWEPFQLVETGTRIYYRLIVVYVQLRRIHNHPSQLGVYTISRRGGVPACTRYSSCKLWTWRRWGASFRDFGSFDMSGEQERFQLELIVALPASDRTSIGSILYRASWMNRHHYR